MKLKSILLSAAICAGCLVGTVGCSDSTGSIGNVGDITFSAGDKIAEITIEDYGTIKAKLFPEIAPNAVENFILLAEQGYYDGLKIGSVNDSMMQGGSLFDDGTGEKALINDDGYFSNEISENARNFYGALCYDNDDGKNTARFYIVSNSTPQDITQYDSEKLASQAETYGTEKELYDSSDDEYAHYSWLETWYTNLSQMMANASDEVKEKYNTVGGYPFWDGGYTVFGQVYEGFDVIEAIAAAERTLDNNGGTTRPAEDIIISSVVITEYAEPSTSETSAAAEPDESAAADETLTAYETAPAYETFSADTAVFTAEAADESLAALQEFDLSTVETEAS